MVIDEPCELNGSPEGSLTSAVTFTASRLSAPSVMPLSGLSAWCGAWFTANETRSSESCKSLTRNG